MANIKFTSDNLTCDSQTGSNTAPDITVDKAPESKFWVPGFKSQSGRSLFLPSH